MSQQNKPIETEKNIDVTRSQNRLEQRAVNHSEKEERPASTEYKGNPPHEHGSHQEGEYQSQSDDATMHPSDIDEENN